MKKDVPSLLWYRIMGHPLSPAPFHTLECFVEATAASRVAKLYGGKRHYKNDQGDYFLSFPDQSADVRCMSATWTPSEANLTPRDDVLVEIIPATRYLCDCGKIHVSDYPYPSMWCQCGQKALPRNRLQPHIYPR